MPRMRPLTLFCLIVIPLSACGAKLAAPEISSEEVQKEREYQRAERLKRDLEKKQKREREYTEMRQRLYSVAHKLELEALEVCSSIYPDTKAECVFEVELGDKDRTVNAYADGNKVVIEPGLMRATNEYEEELAFVIAHELGHNILSHTDSARVTAVLGAILGAVADAATGTYGMSQAGAQLGAQMGSVSYEREADYIASYIAARAGYDVAKSAEFWRKMSNRQGGEKSIYTSTTHPTNPERYVALNKTVEEIQQKKNDGIDLLPALKKSEKNDELQAKSD